MTYLDIEEWGINIYTPKEYLNSGKIGWGVCLLSYLQV